MWMYELCSITVFQENYIIYTVNEEIENDNICSGDCTVEYKEDWKFGFGEESIEIQLVR